MKNTFHTVNPYTQEILETYELATQKEIGGKLEAANDTFKSWKTQGLEFRISALHQISKILYRRKQELAELISLEMGKPVRQSTAEIEKCISLCDFYEVNAPNFLADALIETDARESFISHDPLGVVLAIMPWNYPFWQVFRAVVPALTAGNTVLLKHAQNVSGCALMLEEVFKEAGYPESCLATLITGHENIEQIIASQHLKGVTLTGSEKAGKTIARLAGKHLKKTVLELGGNNACVVWEDADLDAHMNTMIWARMQNTGQSCIAAKRFIVLDEIYDTFLERFTKGIQELSIGDPLKKDTKIGVLARQDLAEKLADQVHKSIEKGAILHYGNERDKAFYGPTVLTKISPGMPAFEEELFGPVACLIRVKDRETSLKMASQSRFGLGTMLFTEDIGAARKSIGKIPDGAFFVNDMVKSDPRLPFGGTKASGYGRELSREGIYEFVNKKTVYIK